MRRPFRAALVMLLSATLFGPAAAAAEDCANVDGTTHDMDLCFQRVYQAAEAALNTLYRRLDDSLASPEEHSLLQQAERAWLQYRDKECIFETAGTRQGTIHPIVVSDCLTEKTKAHVEELQRQLDCGDGDTGCLHERRH